MSYDIYLLDPITKETLILDNCHNVKCGTYQVGGTKKAWLNITWNYSKIFRQILGEDEIRTIYGMTGAESIPILQNAIARLNDDVSDNYWEATEGNVKKSLYGLLLLAGLRPDGIWDGD